MYGHDDELEEVRRGSKIYAGTYGRVDQGKYGTICEAAANAADESGGHAYESQTQKPNESGEQTEAKEINPAFLEETYATRQ